MALIFCIDHRTINPYKAYVPLSVLPILGTVKEIQNCTLLMFKPGNNTEVEFINQFSGLVWAIVAINYYKYEYKNM